VKKKENEMNREITIPVSWEGWNEIDVNFVSIYQATFLEDFGIFKKGETYANLNINYEQGFIEYWEKGVSQKIQYFKCQPIDASEK
jgi:hypothetical protein